MAQKQPWNWATARGRDEKGLQVKCLTADAGHVWMPSYDSLPPAVRQRLAQSRFNICAACLDIAARSLASKRKTPLTLAAYFTVLGEIEREIERGA